jgi:hypothetical protein
MDRPRVPDRRPVRAAGAQAAAGAPTCAAGEAAHFDLGCCSRHLRRRLGLRGIDRLSPMGRPAPKLNMASAPFKASSGPPGLQSRIQTNVAVQQHIIFTGNVLWVFIWSTRESGAR